jgi:hypothetical protein
MSTETHPTKDAPIEPASGWHPVSVGHLVMGVAFAGLVVVWALIASDVVQGDDIRWLLPVPWVLAGVAGLVGLIASDRRRTGARQSGWVDGG